MGSHALAPAQRPQALIGRGFDAHTRRVYGVNASAIACRI